jgi:glycerate-2-kinase
MYEAAVATAHPDTCVPPHLPPVPEGGRILVVGAGKAGAAMARATERHYLGSGQGDRIAGFVTTRHGYGLPTKAIEVIEAGHPVPDANSIASAKRALELAASAGPHDLVLALMSGGASALWSAPVEGVSFEAKQTLTKQLLRSGARISEMNCVRKHLSRIKGGKLAAAAHPARLLTLAISDVPGDDPAAIGSGPTVGDPTTLAEARAVLARYLSGGELTVTVTGNGSGGPNQEFALGPAIALDGAAGIAALAGDTDGTDGGGGNPDDPAGAITTPETLAAARSATSIPPISWRTTIPPASSAGSGGS